MADLPSSAISVTPARHLRRWLFTSLMLLGGLTLGFVLGAVALAIVERQPGLTILDQADAGQVAQNDGRLLIYTRADRIRSCGTTTTHWLFTNVTHAGEAARAYIPIAEDGAVPVHRIGEVSYILSVPLPPGLWPAKWYWLETRTETCGPFGWLWPIYSESEPLPIDIERLRAVPNVPVTATGADGKSTVRSRSPLQSTPPAIPKNER